MRHIEYSKVVEAVSELCGKAACDLPRDVLDSLSRAAAAETGETAREFFRQYLENERIAREERMPICQDTGLAVFFVTLGSQVAIDGGELRDAIEEGTRKGYIGHYLRKSVDLDPVFNRVNTKDNTPCIIHWDIVPGDGLRIVLAPKGGGSENMSRIAMLKPSDGRKGVVDFVVDAVVSAGGNPCPPTVVGVGIGGTFEVAALLAKRALLRKVGEPSDDPNYAELEREILDKINASGIGPQGLGGDITSLAVHIERHPCHLASLPVAVNLNCHAARHAEVEL